MEVATNYDRHERLLDEIASVVVKYLDVFENEQAAYDVATIARAAYKTTQDKSVISTSGPCWSCHTKIEYGQPLHYQHLRFGDPWLKRNIRYYAGLRDQPTEFYMPGWAPVTPLAELGIVSVSKPKRKYPYAELKGYLCHICCDVVEAYYDLMVEHESTKAERRRDQFHNSIKIARKIYDGEIGATVQKMEDAIDLLLRYDNLAGRLIALQYSDFLNSPYWKMVRRMKLRRAKYMCELCSATNVPFHVHHKTYEHHGDEHSYLNDLIVLCKWCHARFHDKEVAS